MRLVAPFRRGQRAGSDASADGGDARQGRRGHSEHPEPRADHDRRSPATLADDRASVSEGLDRTEGRRWSPNRRKVSGASGASPCRRRAPRARQSARGLDEELQGRGALRRYGPAHPGIGVARAHRVPADGRQPERQRRHPPARAPNAGLPCARRARPVAGRRGRPGHARTRQVSPRRDGAKPGTPKLPHLRTRRNALEPARSGVRDHRPPVGRPGVRELLVYKHHTYA